MSPKVEGKSYYKQASPSKRGFYNRGFSVHEHEIKVFDDDVKSAGFSSAGAYLRHLWEQDRTRRGLPPQVPKTQEQ